MACIMSLNKTHEPDCVFWCITNLILGIYLICWAEIGRPFAWATSAGDIASVRTYHLSDKLFCKVITAPATQSAAFTVFVVWDKDWTYYLIEKQMRDCIVLFALTRTRCFMVIEFTIWIVKTSCKYFSVPCSAGIWENFAWFEGSYTSTACPADKSNVGVVVKALRYKPAGRRFYSRWCHWNFSGSTQPLSEMSTRCISWR